MGSTSETIWSHEFAVAFLDVGQGDCSIIKLPNNELILIDVGPSNSLVLSTFFNRYPDSTVHSVVLTHNDKDHCGGLGKLAEVVKIKNIYLRIDRDKSKLKDLFAVVNVIHKRYSTALNELKENSIIWDENNWQLKCIFPQFSKDIVTLSTNPNAVSGMILLSYGDIPYFVWGGDAEYKSIEQYAPKQFFAQVGPHHGAPIDFKSYNTQVSTTTPDLNYISVGTQNQYGHPLPKYIKFQKSRNVSIYCSQMCQECDRNVIAEKRHLTCSELIGIPSIVRSNVTICRGSMLFHWDGKQWQFDNAEAEYQKNKKILKRKLCE